MASHIGVRDLKDLVDCGNKNREFLIDEFPIAVGVWGSSVRPRTGVIGVRGFELHEKRVHEIRDIANSDFPRSEVEIAEGVTVGSGNSREELEEFLDSSSLRRRRSW